MKKSGGFRKKVIEVKAWEPHKRPKKRRKGYEWALCPVCMGYGKYEALSYSEYDEWTQYYVCGVCKGVGWVERPEKTLHESIHELREAVIELGSEICKSFKADYEKVRAFFARLCRRYIRRR